MLRWLVMFGAAIQLLSPGIASIADGLLARENASGPLTHVEATTSATCPVVHPPDCGVCRYLSGTSALPRVGPTALVGESVPFPRCARSRILAAGVSILPNGRAPPAL